MSARLRCVIVDDDPDFLTLIGIALGRVCPALEVISFHSGLEALGYVNSHHTDLIITDFHMPLLDGLRLTHHVRAAGKTIPIIVMSGDPIEAQALAMGADIFLPKKDIPGCLKEIIERLGFKRRIVPTSK